MTCRASPRQILALGTCLTASRSAAIRAYFRDSSIPRKLWLGSAMAALNRKSPLPDPISSSTGWSLPNSATSRWCGLVGRGRVNQVGQYVDRVSSAGHIGNVGFRGSRRMDDPDEVRAKLEKSRRDAVRQCDQLGSAASPGLVMGTPMILP